MFAPARRAGRWRRDVPTPQEAARPLEAQGHSVSGMPGRTPPPEGLPTRATEKCAMTSRTNHHAERPEQIGNIPVPLSALQLRRQDAVKRSLAGDPIATICRELGCAQSWLPTWKMRSEAPEPPWSQERSRRLRTIPTTMSAAVAMAIVRRRETVSPDVSAQVMRDSLRQPQGESIPSRRTIARILKRHAKEVPSYS